MRIMSITILNNEADIIESFVRYNMTYLDKMIILDNGCTDNTILILKLLIQEGYDIEIINESKSEFEQFYLMNKYMQFISERYKPDWIIPLDADEFLMCEKYSIRDYIKKLPRDRGYKVHWRQFVIKGDENQEEDFVCRKFNYSVPHPVGKVFFPVEFFLTNDLILLAGQHDLNGKNLVIENLPDMYMAHYPHRSFQQVQAKALCHSVRYINYMNR